MSIHELVVAPPGSLYRQSWAPRRQRHGTVNADGFGIGWYADGDPVPARYRRRGPIWADPDLPAFARVTRSRAVLAAVRDATPGSQHGAHAIAPYAADRWLFSHNGRITGWPQSVSDLADGLSSAELLDVEARCDSAFLWALILRRLRDGADPAEALSSVVADVAARAEARLNLLLTDGTAVAATASGESMGYRIARDGVLVASESPDDEAGWVELDDQTLLLATRDGVEVRALDPAGPDTSPTTVAGPDHRPTTRLRESAPPTIERRLPADFQAATLRADVLHGLTAEPKSLPPKWFYDARGSALFDEITRLPEYYPTRAEREILTDRAGQIAAATRAHTLIELGAGSAGKTRLLLDALLGAGSLRRYIPTDVSEAALTAAARALHRDYPSLAIHAIVTDFERPLALPGDGRPRLVAFLGGTIGNLPPNGRAQFLTGLRAQLREGDALLLGTDLVKDTATLIAAYDDAAGVTAAFNKNLLLVLDRELGADFDPDAFTHLALWDAESEWIEMRLRSERDQSVKLAELDLVVGFKRGEQLRTEISAKFRPERVETELDAAGFALRAWWTDSKARFGVSLAFTR